MEKILSSARGANKGSKANPTRTCASCQKEDTPLSMVRFVRTDEGEVFPDLKASRVGRGAWVHPRPECLKKLSHSLSRSFKAQVTTPTDRALALLSQAATVRVRQLLGAARREGQIAFGSTLVQEAWDGGTAHLLIVARDARAAADLSCVKQAVPRGLARVWGDKDGLGKMLGRPEVAVVAILDKRLAKALIDAIALALLAPEADRATAAQGPGNDGFAEVE